MIWAHLRSVLTDRGLAPAGGAGGPAGSAEGTVTGIAYDSRLVKPGNVFVALKGQHADGTVFARQAIERGALAIVSEQETGSDLNSV